MKVTTMPVYQDTYEKEQEITFIDPMTGERISLGTDMSPPEEELEVSYDPTEETASYESMAFTKSDLDQKVKLAGSDQSRELTKEELDEYVEMLNTGLNPMDGSTVYDTDKVAIAIHVKANFQKFRPSAIIPGSVIKWSDHLLRITQAEKEYFNKSMSQYGPEFSQLPVIQTILESADNMKSATITSGAFDYAHPMLKYGLIPRR